MEHVNDNDPTSWPRERQVTLYVIGCLHALKESGVIDARVVRCPMPSSVACFKKLVDSGFKLSFIEIALTMDLLPLRVATGNQLDDLVHLVATIVPTIANVERLREETAVHPITEPWKRR